MSAIGTKQTSVCVASMSALEVRRAEPGLATAPASKAFSVGAAKDDAGRKRSSESAKEEAKRTAISVSGDVVLLGWGPTYSRRFGLSSKYSLRRHVGLGRRCGDKSLYRIGTPGLR